MLATRATPPTGDSRSFDRRIDALADIVAHTSAVFARRGFDRTLLPAVEFAIEELFTNAVKYDPSNPVEVDIGVERVEAQPGQEVVVGPQTQIEIELEGAEDRLDKRKTGITYEDIGGLWEEIQRIREMIELPLKHPQVFQRLGIDPPKGVLLHGPPGTGKTLIAKAVANESNIHFISVNGPEIVNKFYGESEAQIRGLFEDAAEKAPSILFIDEIDAIAPKRTEVTGEVEKRIVAQLLALMDGLKSRGEVIVMRRPPTRTTIFPATPPEAMVTVMP